jgi:hypothetical protein
MPLLRDSNLGKGGIQLDELQAFPKRTKRHPGCTCIVEYDIGVNGIPQIAVGMRLNHDAMIGPRVVAVGRIKGFVGSHPNRRSVFGESRNRIIQIVQAIVENNIGCPDMVPEIADYRICPSGFFRKNRCRAGPVLKVGRNKMPDPPSCTIQVVRIAFLDDNRIVHRDFVRLCPKLPYVEQAKN